MHQDLKQFKEKVKENDENLNILAKLYASGIIDEEGILTINKDNPHDKVD